MEEEIVTKKYWSILLIFLFIITISVQQSKLTKRNQKWNVTLTQF